MASIEERIQSVTAPEAAPEAPAESVQAEAEPTEQVVEQAAESVSESVPESVEEPVEEIEINTLEDIARHLNVDVNELYKTKLTLDVDGETKQVEIGEYKDRTYDGEKLARERREAQSIREASQAEANQAHQRIERSLLEAAELTTEAENRLVAEYQSIDWAQLRADDPAEWTARKQEIDERQRQIHVAKQRVEERFRGHVERQQSEMSSKTQEQLAREFEMLKTAIPEWRDESVMKRESADMRDYLAESGFKPNEIGQVADHRLVVLLRKAQAYDKQMKTSAVNVKRVVKVGRTAKPGTTTNKAQQAAEVNKSLRQNLRKSGSTQDAAALIAALNRT